MDSIIGGSIENIETGVKVMLFREKEMAALEALLFVAKDPLTEESLAELLNLTSSEVAELVQDLEQVYAAPEHGLALIRVNDGFKIGTKPELGSYIEALYKQPAQSLSAAALEVLSIIAYKQPTTRGEIDFLRGVQSDRAVATLVEKGLVKEVGRKEGPGRPILFGTTDKFLIHFGLQSLAELPILQTEFLAESAGAAEEEQ